MRIGSLVQVIDENLIGKVTKVEQSQVYIETEDGFLLCFHESEIIPLVPLDTIDVPDARTISKMKEGQVKRKLITPKPSKKVPPPLEVDLHIHQLTNGYKHLSNYEMLNLQLDVAKRQLEFAIRKKVLRVVFIHGVGSGVLRAELEFLFKRYDHIDFYDADYQKYGQGATEVRIFQNKKD